MAAPIGNSFAGLPPWNFLIDQSTGYPNNRRASGHQWSGSVSVPASANFHGPWVLAWDGDGQIIANFGGWTEVNAAIASATLTSDNPSILAKQNYVVGQKVTSGTTIGNIVSGTPTISVLTG